MRLAADQALAELSAARDDFLSALDREDGPAGGTTVRFSAAAA